MFSYRRALLRARRLAAVASLVALAGLTALLLGTQAREVRAATATAPVAAPATPDSELPLADEPDLLVPLDLPEPPPQNKTLIVLDAGHGGGDLGAEASALREKDLTLSLAQAVAAALEQTQRFNVRLTRSRDADPPTSARANAAAQGNPGLVISIHAGASYSSAARGIEIYYPATNFAPASAPKDFDANARAEKSRQLGQAVADAASAASGMPIHGIHAVPLQLLSASTARGFLVEVGNLSNSDDAALLRSADFRAQFASSVAQVLAQAAGPAPAGGSAQ